MRKVSYNVQVFPTRPNLLSSWQSVVSRRTPLHSDWSHAPLRTGRAQLRHPAPRMSLFTHLKFSCCAMLVSFVFTVSPVQSPASVSLQAVSYVTPLPSSGITRCHQYYGSNPTSQWHLPSSPLQLVWHTLLAERPFWDLPGFPHILNVQLGRALDPGGVYLYLPFSHK